ncbi:hypothetical protein C4552_01880 [Candidatus Parcubacteria bacterium]|nr:MAG: hypothetical protein C4552_01880 [Candidatus Parcubacteria bacterium]
MTLAGDLIATLLLGLTASPPPNIHELTAKHRCAYPVALFDAVNDGRREWAVHPIMDGADGQAFPEGLLADLAALAANADPPAIVAIGAPLTWDQYLASLPEHPGASLFF